MWLFVFHIWRKLKDYVKMPYKACGDHSAGKTLNARLKRRIYEEGWMVCPEIDKPLFTWKKYDSLDWMLGMSSQNIN